MDKDHTGISDAKTLLIAFANDDQALAEASWNENIKLLEELDDKWLVAAPIARRPSRAES